MEATVQNKSTFGIMAIVFGFIAFGGVIGHFFMGPIDPPPPIEFSIAEKAASIRDATVAALRGEDVAAEPALRQRTKDDYLTFGLLGLAGLSILMALIGLVKQERLRVLVAGAGLGGLAIAFQVATVVFFALLFVLLITPVIEQLDFGLFD